MSTDLPAAPGRDTSAILAAAASGELGALLIGGVELADLPDPAAALAALDAAPFVVSLELRESAVTALADVVFPVAPVVEKSGAFLNWEGRHPALRPRRCPATPPPICGCCRSLADELGVDLGLGTGRRRAGTATGAGGAGRRTGSPRTAGPGEAVLASWRMLLDAGRLQDGEPHLAGTARPAGGAAVRGHRRRDRRRRRRSGHRAHRPRRDQPAAGDHRHARPGGLAADELPRQRRARTTGRARPATVRARSSGGDIS